MKTLTSSLLAVLVVIVPSLASAATKSIPLPRARSAALEPHSGRLFVAVGGAGITVLDTRTDTVTGTIPGTGDVEKVIVDGSSLLGVSTSHGGASVLRIPLAALRVTETFAVPGIDDLLRNAIPLAGDRLLVVSGSPDISGFVVSLDRATVLKRMRLLIRGLVYADAGHARRGNRLLFPGAYPGEIADIDLSGDVRLAHHFRVNDWIHDVKFVNDHVVVTAGHLDGVSLIDLNATPSQGGLLPSEVVSGTLWTHLLVEGSDIRAVSQGKLETISLPSKSKHVTSRDIPTLSSGPLHNTNVIPLGRDGSGRLVVLEEGAGVHLIE